MSSAALGLDGDWPRVRWAKILDRIEHRQADLGLRFWGPPLWLEVTMTGPDSDLWPANIDLSRQWDWQSSRPCAEVDALVAQGAGDDRLLAAVGQYTIENLILNAAHEIGEWLRFDGRRLFPAHLSRVAAPDVPEDQGNGTVRLQIDFARTTRPANAQGSSVSDPLIGQRLLRRLGECALASRFTYLPGVAISYEAIGPVIRRWRDEEPPTVWRSAWSRSSLEASSAEEGHLLELVGQDVHRALVFYEADRICRAFHIDGVRPWFLGLPDSPLGDEPSDKEATRGEPLAISISYTPLGLAGAGLA